jgi:uncharacterized protein VirK/YbjX
MGKIIDLGKSIYNMDNPREQRRFVVFVARYMLHHSEMQRLREFFEEIPIKQELSRGNPFFYEQVTRQFFYKGSTFAERKQLIQENIDILVAAFSDDSLRQLYVEKNGIQLWQEVYQGEKLSLELHFDGGQRKEGTLSVILKWGEAYLYQMIFWLRNEKDSGQPALYIGAMQGPNIVEANEVVKDLTKRFFGYRTKNLILYATRAFARGMGVGRIYAVTNEGYYANNHVRVDRKLKTSFSDFWEEAGGQPALDSRYYMLPLIEHRKTIEEIKTHKRSQYRKRFAVLDEIDQSVDLAVQRLLR